VRYQTIISEASSSETLRIHLIPTLSVALCISTLIPWISTQNDDAQFSIHFRSTRYTLHSFEGRLSLAGPISPFVPRVDNWLDGLPNYTAPTTPQALNEAFQRASEIRNTDIWRFHAPVTRKAFLGTFTTDYDLSPTLEVFYPRYDPKSIYFRANVIALLSALEDPHRCVAADSVLRNYANHQLIMGSRNSRGDLIQRWHDKLDQRIFSIWYGTVFLATATLPLLHLTRPRARPRRLRRWAFNTAALLSATIAIAVVFAALIKKDLEFNVWQVLYKPTAAKPTEIRLFLDWYHGTVSFGAQQGRETIGEWAESHDIRCRPYSELRSWPTAWFLPFNDATWEATGRILRLPWPLVALALTLLPAAHLRSFLRNCPHPGHCPVCGYDLRASPTRCPECGAAQPATLPAAWPLIPRSRTRRSGRTRSTSLPIPPSTHTASRSDASTPYPDQPGGPPTPPRAAAPQGKAVAR
jgi:hypothetical protein